jgi:hypothetical protein
MYPQLGLIVAKKQKSFKNQKSQFADENLLDLKK